MGNDNPQNRVSEAGAAAGGPVENAVDETSLTEAERLELRHRRAVADAVDETSLTEEQRLALRRRRAMAKAVDDADASHQGGFGAQGGAVDFGKPKNFGLPK